TLREIKVRYKQSVLGLAWAILQPFALMLMFTLVFSYFTRFETDGAPYPIFAYTALVPWTLLATSISFSSSSLTTNLSLVTKIYFPKEILPLGTIGAALLDFLVAITVFIVIALFYQVPLTITWIWVPLLLVVQVSLIIGVSLFAAAVNVFYRDIRFVVPLGLQLWMYASPVIYPVSMVPDRLKTLYMLNPMAGLISSYRRVVLMGEPPDLGYLLLATIESVLVFFIGYLYFKYKEPEFADVI
ncbi:MAG: ABC transporter permease, partial [Anaerolineales bacterium]|nr:ABC transporter permease [Anaerolineales bacterium]